MATKTGVADPNKKSGGDKPPADSDKKDEPKLEPLDQVFRKIIFAQDNDVGNATRFIFALREGRFGQKEEHLKFVTEWNWWTYWDGNRWVIDIGNAKTMRLYTAVMKKLYKIVKKLDLRHFDNDSKKAEKLRNSRLRFLKESLNKGKIMAALDIASKQTYFRINSSEFDNEPIVAACLNGHLDLEKQKRINPDPARLITKQFNAEFNAEAKCPRWDQFIDEITCGDEEYAKYLQKFVGYCLTGDTEEHIALNIIGNGSNGKSVFTNALLYVWGEYGVKVPNDVITKQGRGGGGDESKASPQTAMLKGARFALTTELEEGMWIGESKFKDLVSSDMLTARRLRCDPESWSPSHKLWFCGNHVPNVKGNDDGIWRRLKQVKFQASIDKPDKSLPEQFKTNEAKSYILAWALKGLEMFLKEDRGWTLNLQEPSCVKQWNKEYRSNEDILGQFISECCVSGSDKLTSNVIMRLGYDDWCKRNGYHGLKAAGLAKALRQRNLDDHKSSGIRLRMGLELKPSMLPIQADIFNIEFSNDKVIVFEDRKNHNKVSNGDFFWWLKYLKDSGHFNSNDWKKKWKQEAVENIGTDIHECVIRHYRSDAFIHGTRTGGLIK